MSHSGVDVVLIGDGNTMIPSVSGIISTTFRMASIDMSEILGLAELRPRAVVCCFHNVPHLLGPGRFLSAGISPESLIFLFMTYKKENIDRVQRIGASTYFVAPFDSGELIAAVKQAINVNVEAGWAKLRSSEQAALRATATSFDNTFMAIAHGKRLPANEIYSACDKIRDSLDDSNVDRWLGALRHHHNCTYRHSMFVCGVIAFFARSLGISGQDLRQLTVGGFLHDAGKAYIPLGILDKPAKLDKDEWEIMRKHPEHSRAILMRESGLNEEIVAMAVQHHEKLDGTGYPDGLDASQLGDHARITAIADVYSALVEERAYKPPMQPEKALEMMGDFRGHLDLDLVGAFRKFVLQSDSATNAVA